MNIESIRQRAEDAASPTTGHAWAERLLAVCRGLAQQPAPPIRDRLREEAWLLLDTALVRFIHWHAGRLGAVTREEAEDIAAEKALDVLSRAEGGQWDLTQRTGGELVAFLSNVARNGLVDRLRLRSRVRMAGDQLELSAHAAVLEGRAEPVAEPVLGVEAREYASQLVACVSKLKPRARVMWFLRVMHEWPSARIASHPEVERKPAHVDVELQRARAVVRACMQHAGFDVHEIPQGAFAALWAQLMLKRPDPAREHGDTI